MFLPFRRSATRIALASAVLAVAAFVPGAADAHFILQSPASWKSQDALGSPQKLGPCGDENGGSATGKITTFQAGQTITIMIDETIYHPGHYRVALAVHDRSELPPEPPVTAGSSACGSVPIMSPPVFPVLADGMLPHSAPFSGPQSFQVTLPSDVTCDHCTLQVIEFMSQHPLNNPGGCFYHHCADIAIQGASAGAGGAAGTTGAGGTNGAAGVGAGGSGASGASAGGPATGGGNGTAGSNGVAGGPSGTGAGGAKPTSTGGAAGTSGATSNAAAPAPASSGCGCTVTPPSGTRSFVALALALAVAARRRRRA